MKAIILAAGKGERLQPLTLEIPKTLVKYNNKSILEYILESLELSHINKVAVVVGYKKEKIENMKNNDIELYTYFNPLFDSTNMVYSLSFAKNFVYDNDEDFIVSYGDIIYSSNIVDKLINSNDADISLISDRDWKKLWSIRMEDIYSDVESFKVENNKVKELGKKTRNENDIQGQYIGLFKVHKNRVKDFFDIYQKMQYSLEENVWKKMYMTSYLQYLIDIGWNVKPIWINGNWIEIDTLNDIQQYIKYNIIF